MGSDNEDFAKLYIPFAALRGYDELLKSAESEPERRRELSEDEAELLSRKMNMAGKGKNVSVTFYKKDRYVTANDTVKKVDRQRRVLVLEKISIPMDDIIDMDIEGISFD